MSDLEKTVFDMVAPIVGLPPNAVEVRFSQFALEAVEEISNAAASGDVVLTRKLFNAAAREVAKRNAEAAKAVIEDEDLEGLPVKVVVDQPSPHRHVPVIPAIPAVPSGKRMP